MISILLTLTLSLITRAECIEILPGRALGSLRIGQAAPAGTVGKYPIEADSVRLAWKIAGPYRFEKNAAGKIIQIQYDPIDKNNCYSLNGKILPNHRDLKQMQKELGNCEFVSGIGNMIVCDGMEWMRGSETNHQNGGHFRVDVMSRSLNQWQEEQATFRVHSVMRKEWPYIDFSNKR